MKDNLYNHSGEFVPVDDYLSLTPEEEVEILSGLEEKVHAPEENDKPKDENFIKDILTEKIHFLRDILEEIEVQITDRDALKEVILDKVDKGVCYLQTKIYELDNWGLGHNRDIDLRRSKLEKELETLKKQKRDEERENWRDIALLKKEHREFYRQYREALRRVKVIFPQESQDQNHSGDEEK